MPNPLPKLHVCQNCGFLSTREDLFEIVEGLLQCKFCIDAYTVFLFEVKPPAKPA